MSQIKINLNKIYREQSLEFFEIMRALIDTHGYTEEDGDISFCNTDRYCRFRNFADELIKIIGR